MRLVVVCAAALLVVVSAAMSVSAYSSTFVSSSSSSSSSSSMSRSCRWTIPAAAVGGKRQRSGLGLSMRVVGIDSPEAFDKTIESAGNALVVVDYSTTWCGPCKVIAPKFDELSDKYPDAVFLKVIGDASPDASKLMKREGVRSVPSFHYFVDGKKVEVVNGANAEAIEAAIAKYTS